MKAAWLLVYSVCLRIVPAAMLGLASVGCATVMGGSRDQEIRISSTPLGAMVLVDGQPKGPTPVNVLLSRKSDHDVDIQLAGYQSYHTTIRSGFNPWVLGNILLGGPVGLVIDLVADSCYRLDPGDNKAVLHAGYVEAANVPAGQPFALHPPP